MKTVTVVFEGGPEDGLVRVLPEPLHERYRFPRYGTVTVVSGMTTIPAATGRYVYLLSTFPDDRGRQRYQYEGEE